MNAALFLGEAILLGLVSGPACVASCGPVLVPSLLAAPSGIKANSRYLGVFLVSRLFGYLLFAVVAWQLGQLARMAPSSRTLAFAIIHLALAVLLLWYARSVGKQCHATCATTRLVNIGSNSEPQLSIASATGLLTGVSLCPPFVAAGVRAAELGSVSAALLFFAVFFVGTSVWFLPFVGIGFLRRSEAVFTVARMTMVLIAAYYAFAGISLLVGA